MAVTLEDPAGGSVGVQVALFVQRRDALPVVDTLCVSRPVQLGLCVGDRLGVCVGTGVTDSNLVSVALPVGVTVERIVAVGTAVPDAVGDGV